MTNKADNVVQLFPRREIQAPDRAPPFDPSNPSHARAWQNMWEYAQYERRARLEREIATAGGLGR